MHDSDPIARLTLDEHGMIRDCNQAGEVLFRYQRADLIRQHVSMLLPPLERIPLLINGQPNSHLRYLCRVGCLFQGISKAGDRFLCELFLTKLGSSDSPQLSMIVRPGSAQCVNYVVSQPAREQAQSLAV